MTDKKRSRKPVFFRPDFRKRAVQGRDYLQALWNKGERFWEERFFVKQMRAKEQEKKARKEEASSPPPGS